MREREVRIGRTANVRTVGLPLIGESTKAVGIGKGIVGCERLTLSCSAGDFYGPSGGVIDIGNRSGCAAAHRFVRSKAVGVAGHNRDGFTDFSLRERQIRTGGTANVRAIRFPLVGDRAKAICISKVVLSCERLTLACSAADFDGPSGRVVDVGNDTGWAAADRLVRTKAIDIAGGNGDRFTDFSLREGVA